MTIKKCNRCKKDKPVLEFNAKQHYCKECHCEISKKHYRENKQRHKDGHDRYRIKSRKINNVYVIEFLLANPCTDCGETNVLILEFDHVFDNKTEDVSSMVSKGYGVKRIQEEIDKCEVVCRNCHSIRTHKRANTTRWRLVQEMNGHYQEDSEEADAEALPRT